MNIKIVTASEKHLSVLASLPPFGDHHCRLAIAQAITDCAPLVSSYSKFPLQRRHGVGFKFNERPKKEHVAASVRPTIDRLSHAD